MTVHSRTTIFIVALLLTGCFLGNYKIITSYLKYREIIQLDQKQIIESAHRYFSQNDSMPEEVMLEYLEIASERKLDFEYINPWFSVNLLIYNLLFVTIAWICFEKLRQL